MPGRDRGGDPEWPIRADARETEVQRASSPSRQRGLSPVLIALGGLLLLLLIIWFFSTNRSPDQDKLTGSETATTDSGNAEARCASKATYDLIKRELFRRAAQMRGSDQAAFDRLSAYATLRMENPVLESTDDETGAINCSGSLSIDLPPGVSVVGGRRSLSANIDYTLQGAADQSGDVVLLRNSEPIVTPLATLARVDQPPAQTSAPGPDPLAPLPGADPSQPAAPVEPSPPPAAKEPATAAARPSFDCGRARTAGEIAVCRSPGLAALDRQMAAQFSEAMAEGGSEERALLQRTRSRFLSYRDACRSDSCIADAYRGRMREIDDISAGRWRPRG